MIFCGFFPESVLLCFLCALRTILLKRGTPVKILVINPGSTSTKVSLFENDTLLFEESPFHDAPELLAFPSVNDQIPFRESPPHSIPREE